MECRHTNEQARGTPSPSRSWRHRFGRAAVPIHVPPNIERDAPSGGHGGLACRTHVSRVFCGVGIVASFVPQFSSRIVCRRHAQAMCLSSCAVSVVAAFWETMMLCQPRRVSLSELPQFTDALHSWSSFWYVLVLHRIFIL